MFYVVTGPPAAGKTTWVGEHAKPGDVTIDLDALVGVLTPAGGEALSLAVKAVAAAARSAAIDTAVRWSRTVDVYLIHSMPRPSAMRRYRMQRACVITVDPGKDVVMARCERQRSFEALLAAARYYEQQQAARDGI